MRILSFLTRLHRWIRWTWSSLIFGIVGASVFQYATTGSVTLAPTLFSFLTEHVRMIVGAVLVLVSLTGVTWWAKRRKRAYEAFRTIKRGASLLSPNEIAYAPVYDDENSKDRSRGRDLLHRPSTNKYVPLPLVRQQETKQRGIDDASTYTDADLVARLEEEHILLIGSPTAGKTRKAFEILKDLPDRYVVVPRHETLDQGLPQEATRFLSEKEVIIVLDDLDKYAKDGKALREYLRTIEDVTASCAVLGTCRDNTELELSRGRRGGKPLLSPGSKDVYQLFSRNRYLVTTPSTEQYRKIAEGAGLDPSTLHFKEYETPADLLLKESKTKMADRFENDLSPNEKNLLHAAQLLDKADVRITHDRLRWTFKEMLGRDGIDSKAVLEDMLVRLGSLGFITSPWKRDPVALEQAYAGLETGIVPYRSDRAVEEDLLDLISVLGSNEDVQGLFALGNYLRDRGFHDSAVESYDQAVGAEPSSVSVWTNRGAALQEQGNLEEAIESYNQAVEADPSCAEAWHDRGLALQEQGNLKEAIKSYDRVLDVDSSYAGVWYNRGVALYDRGNLEEAIKSYDRALDVDPSYASAWYGLGLALHDQGNLEEAIDSFDQALDVDPSYAGVWHNRGVALHDQGNLEEAINSFDQALDVDPSYASAWYNRGVALYDQGNLEEAIDSFDQALGVDSSYANAWYSRGIALRDQSNLEEAIDSFDRALDADSPHANAWYDRGLALSKRGNLEEAIDSFDRALDVDPSHARAWFSRGITLYATGEKETAAEGVDRACELDSTYCGPYPWENSSGS